MLTIDQLQFRFASAATSAVKAQNSVSSNTPMNFSLTVEAGEILSVIGPSGSGKTTLLNLIAGFLTPNSGRILVNDKNISDFDVSQRPVTTVFQENNLFPHLDIFTNVALGIKPSLKLDKNDKQKIHHALESLGLDDLSKRQPKALSGGQRQRVALARALVRKHSILLLDEPLAALGPAMREEILELIQNLVKTENMHALLISHQPEDALQISPRTAFIHNGEVLAIDDTNNLLSHSTHPEIKQYLGEN